MGTIWGKNMSGSKHFDRIAVVTTVLILVLTILFMNGATLGISATEHTMGYEHRLFDNTKVHTVDIVMNDWEQFIADATSEEYDTANVVIDGEAYKNVGIRAKGNTSLSTVSSLGSERYSFKIEFDHYDSTKSYHGLDKLSLNNLIQDSTMMKDYLTYTMMNEFGVNSPLCSYVYITVNGEDWGLYLAVEGVEESFLERNYGSDYGELYKPDSMSFGGGRGNGKDFDMSDFEFDSGEGQTDSSGLGKPSGNFDMSDIPEDFDPSSMFGNGNGENGGRGFGGGMGGMGSSDVKLQYIDDDPDSYSNIWNNAKTDITNADQNRLIESLEKLSSGEEIESVVDAEQVIRYFVVHNYVCNGDSYTGVMIHNYYLYEEDGQMAMIPWDYNLAFGTFQAGNGQSTVNTPIDAPVSGGSGEDRPMWSWILSDERYTELYHQYFMEFLSNVDIQGIIGNAYDLIKSYVEKDPTAFYTCEEFETGVETLRQFCTLRSESISMQLETGETTKDMGYVDASSLTLSDMGSMNSGGMGGFGGPDNSNGFDRSGFEKGQDSEAKDNAAAQSSGQNGAVTGTSSSEEATGNIPPDMPEEFDGEMPEGFDPANLPEGFNGGFPGQPSGDQTQMTPSDGSDAAGDEDTGRPYGGNMQMPGGDFNSDINGSGSPSSDLTGWIWTAVSVLVLGIGLVVAKFFKH